MFFRPISCAVVAAVLLASATAADARPKSAVADFLSDITTPSARPHEFAAGTIYTLCFVPDGPSCERLLVDTINSTKRSLLIQAYSFTSAPIAQAVVKAHQRGVDVRVILDKSQVSQKYTSATFLRNEGVPLVIDTKPAIAHNKVMVFDHEAVFTGSFNFTRAAQSRNAENGMVIRGDSSVVKAYTDNWTTRFNQSTAY
jgi:phosphatidylserine/phosphatidylglycerophosphate/cardiolipin synthase-like enzyme